MVGRSGTTTVETRPNEVNAVATNAPPVAIHALGAAVFALGAAVVRKGLSQRSEGAELDELETSDIADVRAGDGLVEVTGTARAGEAGTIDAPILGTDGLVVVSTVEEARAQEKPEAKGEKALVTVHKETRSEPFLVEDGAGTALVEVPEGADTPMEATSVTVESGSSPPETVRQLLATIGSISPDEDSTRIYHQAAIEPGEEVYVVGEATAPGDPRVDLDVKLTGETDPERMVVSDYSGDAVASGKRREGTVTLIPGLITALFGLFVFVIPLL